VKTEVAINGLVRWFGEGVANSAGFFGGVSENPTTDAKRSGIPHAASARDGFV
jgi:hypothetical protein